TVPSFMPFENSVRLAVELVTNGKLAKAVREQITMKAFNFPDLIADIHGLCCFAHLSSPVPLRSPIPICRAVWTRQNHLVPVEVTKPYFPMVRASIAI